MAPQFAIEPMIAELRGLYRRDPSTAALRIERYLAASLEDLEPERKWAVLEQIRAVFGGSGEAGGAGGEHGGKVESDERSGSLGGVPASAAEAAAPGIGAAPVPAAEALDQRTLRTVLRRLLKDTHVRADLPADEMLEKVAAAMTVIFETLNQLVAQIQTSLYGRGPELETIRWVIGAAVEGQGGGRSIEGFLDQIREAFRISHQAFQLAAADKLREVLHELEPAVLLARASSGLRRGPFGKAVAFELFKEKHALIGQWLGSERFRQDLLRAFESHCLRLTTRPEENP